VSRLHPYDHAFAELAEVRFGEIRDEAVTDRRDLRDRAQFTALASVQRLLTEMESPELLADHPEAAVEYVTALYVAYRFWDAGCCTLALSRERLEIAIAEPPEVDQPMVPRGACYLQLPERWFWAQIDADAPHEPLDGILVVEDALGRDLSTLAVLGLRADRPGFSQIALAAVPDDIRAASAEKPDFTPTLDGGDAAGLKSVTTPAALLHLVRLALDSAADSISRGSP
jgi:hypothetical protein